MTLEKIIAVAQFYQMEFVKADIPKQRMDITLTPPPTESLLPHAHYLSDNVIAFARQPNKIGRANRHLAALQMCLLMAGWFSIKELGGTIRRRGNSPRCFLYVFE